MYVMGTWYYEGFFIIKIKIYFCWASIAEPHVITTTTIGEYAILFTFFFCFHNYICQLLFILFCKRGQIYFSKLIPDEQRCTFTRIILMMLNTISYDYTLSFNNLCTMKMNITQTCRSVKGYYL